MFDLIFIDAFFLFISKKLWKRLVIHYTSRFVTPYILCSFGTYVKRQSKKNPFHGRHTHLASVKFILFYKNFHLFFSILISIKLFIHKFLVFFLLIFSACECLKPQNFPCGRHSNSGSHTVFRLHSGTLNVYACTVYIWFTLA